MEKTTDDIIEEIRHLLYNETLTPTLEANYKQYRQYEKQANEAKTPEEKEERHSHREVQLRLMRQEAIPVFSLLCLDRQEIILNKMKWENRILLFATMLLLGVTILLYGLTCNLVSLAKTPPAVSTTTSLTVPTSNPAKP